MRKKNIILLTGFSRSGTTWLSKIFDSMPTTLVVSEPDKRINKHLLFGQVKHCIDDFENGMARAYRESMDEIINSKFCCLRSYPYFKKDYCTVPHKLYSLISGTFQLLDHLIQRTKFSYPLRLPGFLFQKNNNFDLVWKSVNQSSNIPFLQNTFPDIKIIYMLRNPYSTLASILSNNRMKLDGEDFRRINERKGSLFFKTEKFTNLNEIEHWDELKKRALLWRIDCESAIKAGLNNKNFYLVLYENMVSDPFKETSDILRWLNLPFYQETQTFLAQSTGRKKPPFFNKLLSSGYFGVYRKPGVDFSKWKKVITKEDYDLISPLLNQSPLLKLWPHDIVSL